MNNGNHTDKYHLSYSTVYEDVYEPSYGTGFIFYDEEEETSSHGCDDGFVVPAPSRSLITSFSNRQKR